MLSRPKFQIDLDMDINIKKTLDKNRFKKQPNNFTNPIEFKKIKKIIKNSP